LGLRTAVYTSVERDGTGAGVDIAVAQALARQSGLMVIASGGVAGLAEVRAARQAGLAGLVIGQALYTGQIDLREALAC
jgi:phosphoribosylformimino-5-aminoimidazole carboxamide ribotide isomerase